MKAVSKYAKMSLGGHFLSVYGSISSPKGLNHNHLDIESAIFSIQHNFELCV